MKAGAARPYTMSLALHVAVGVLLVTGIHFSQPVTVTPAPAPVEAVVADRAVLDALAQQQRVDQQRAREAAARAAEQRAAEQARLEQQRQAAEQAAAEQARLVAQQQAAAAAKRQAEAAAAAAAKRKADAAAAAKRQAEQEAAARKAREQAAAAAAKRKAEADARQRARREADLQARLADEERHTAAVSSGLLNQYVGLLQARIERNWIRPPSARAGLKCTLHITQIPGGEVVNASLGDCNGDAVVKQSILDAVLRASPLPAPPDPSLFTRNLNIVFEPKD